MDFFETLCGSAGISENNMSRENLQFCRQKKLQVKIVVKAPAGPEWSPALSRSFIIVVIDPASTQRHSHESLRGQAMEHLVTGTGKEVTTS